MAKKEIKNKLTSKKFEKYTTKDGKIERKPSCPRCGAGIFLAQHQGRQTCGSCGYTIFETKKKEEPKK